MKTDRELLELAAKAAGIVGVWTDSGSTCDECKNKLGPGIVVSNWDDFWNPLTDDGDALRLAVQLELSLRLCHSENEVRVYGSPYGAIDEGVRGYPGAAARRAIVRAAAEIGASMQCPE